LNFFSKIALLKVVKKIIFFIFLISLFIAFISPLHAQEKSSAAYYQDLLQNYRRYQGQIEPFNTKKSRNFAYQSVDTQAEFLQATKQLIIAEIVSIKSYTLFMRTLLVEATQIINYQENYLYIKFDDELSFLDSANVKANNLISLSDARALMVDLEKHYKQISLMGYQAKSLIAVGSVKKIYDNLKVEQEKLANYLGAQTQSGPSVNAAKEKFENSNKGFGEVEILLTQLNNLQKSMNQGVADEIQRVVQQTATKLNQILNGYKNIVFSLK